MKDNSNVYRDAAKAIALPLIGFLLSFSLAALGYRFNSTPSLPEGIWKVDTLAAPVRRGQIVSIAPPDTAIFRLARDRGYICWGACPGGYCSLLKPVAAIPGDRICVSDKGIAVNGQLLPHSQPALNDSIGRGLAPMLKDIYVVQPGTVWLVSDCPRGFDSRYFGAVPTANILGTAKPVLVGGLSQ